MISQTWYEYKTQTGADKDSNSAGDVNLFASYDQKCLGITFKIARRILEEINSDSDPFNSGATRSEPQTDPMKPVSLQCEWCNKFYSNERGVIRHKVYCRWQPQRLRSKILRFIVKMSDRPNLQVVFWPNWPLSKIFSTIRLLWFTFT